MIQEELFSAQSVEFSDICVHSVMDTGFQGLFRLTPEMHTHPFFEVQARVAGAYVIEFLDREPICMEENMLCIIPPSCYHSTHSLSEKTEKLALRYTYERNWDVSSEVLYPAFHAALSAITEPVVLCSQELCDLILKIHREQILHWLGAEEMTRFYMGQFYIHLLRQLNDESQGSISKKRTVQDSDTLRYGRIEQFFGEHFSKPITEKDLAAALKLSTRQISRILRSIYGMSFREKLTDIRMVNAAKLLVTTELSIKQVASKVGYESVAGFYLAFRKHYGVSGSEYRAQIQGKQ